MSRHPQTTRLIQRTIQDPIGFSSAGACLVDNNSSNCGRLRMTFDLEDTRSPKAHENERASDRVSRNAGELQPEAVGIRMLSVSVLRMRDI